jgi:hypothetical protein
MAKKLDPIPPGEILAEEFMKPGRISCRTAEREGRAAQAHPRRDGPGIEAIPPRASPRSTPGKPGMRGGFKRKGR